ncbi:EKC/KEOPS complex subunit TPRKB [Anoplophora glabripennis]|uniref:TP53RK-binding protein n=1 Tax=Anoplophora glabripennis TaxID=217634 RepID=V5GEZ7_ANOGL|nr:EKC/KEOPS complex subunit TPRKB [Anoplophora glabripennis]
MDLDYSTKAQLEIRLYQKVKNMKDLKRKLTKGQLKCCIIKPSLIYDPFQVVVAANKALTAEKLTTKTIFTEILFNLSISKHITKSLQTFSVGDDDENLLVVTLADGDDGEDESIYNAIDGEEVELSNLRSFSDMNEIKKVYKISEKETLNVPFVDSIVSRIATKDFLSH